MGSHLRTRFAIGILILFAAAALGIAWAQEKGGEKRPVPTKSWPKAGRIRWDIPDGPGDRKAAFSPRPPIASICSTAANCRFPTKRPRATRAATARSDARHARQAAPGELHSGVRRQGKLLEDWTQWDHLFAGGRGPHHVKISPYDPEKHVWVIDDMVQQIFEFTHDGKQLVLTLGERVRKRGRQSHFGRPTDIAWLPDGTFFISDGYVNTRVMKFDKNGKFLMTWGTKGTGPGQFDLPHSIDIDAKRRVYVADRSNSRIQIFDENGKYLDQWDNIRSPYHILITADQHLWVADGVTNKFLKYDLNGKLLYSWGTYGTFPGAFWGVHQFSVDSDGNLYAAETFGGRTQKFRPKKGADPATLIGQPGKVRAAHN